MTLPLIDGNTFFFDHSALEYLICQRAGQHHTIDGRVSSGSNSAQNFGGAIHYALEYLYKRYGTTPGPNCRAEMHQVLTDWFKEKPAPLECYRTLSLATQVVDAYLEKYKSEEWAVAHVNGQPAVEMPFALPLTRIHVKPHGWLTMMFCGKIDLIVLEHRDFWTLDTKTSKMAGASVQAEQQMSFQWPGYCHALRELTGITPYGAMVNFIRVREPNKKGPEDYTPEQIAKRKYKPRKPVELDDFQRMRFILEPHHLPEWKENIISLWEGFFHNYERGFFPMQRKQCINKYGKCPFIEVCGMPPDLRPQALIDFTSPDTFSPLNTIKSNYANSQTTPSPTP